MCFLYIFLMLLNILKVLIAIKNQRFETVVFSSFVSWYFSITSIAGRSCYCAFSCPVMFKLFIGFEICICITDSGRAFIETTIPHHTLLPVVFTFTPQINFLALCTLHLKFVELMHYQFIWSLYPILLFLSTTRANPLILLPIIALDTTKRITLRTLKKWSIHNVGLKN